MIRVASLNAIRLKLRASTLARYGAAVLGAAVFSAPVACCPTPTTLPPPTTAEALGPATPPAASAAPPEGDMSTHLHRLEQRLNAMAEATLSFWLKHGVDREYGGFHGTLDRTGAPIEPSDKGLVQQTRHLWTLSMWQERRGGGPALRQVADRSYRFVIEHFLDKDGEFFFKVDREGALIDPKKQLYAESFAIYALATYGRAFGVEQAKEQALACFRSIDRRAHDNVHGGYDQRNDPGWLAPGAEKGTNTHLHLLEAFTTLYQVSGDHMVKERLSELVDVVTDRLLQPAGYVHKEFLMDFTPHLGPVQSYGHDIETAWLLMDAAEALGRDAEDKVRNAARRMAQNAADDGYDDEHGGFFYEGPPGAPPTDKTKVWWVQFEGLPGLLALYALDLRPQTLTRFAQNVAWLERTVDRPYGEWFWGISEQGQPDSHGDAKGQEWKTSYHGLRALVFAADRLKALQQPPAPRP